MNRYKASALHLGASFLIGLGIFLWLHQVWYPGVLFTLTGGLSLLKILLSVDIVIGPVITLVIFNPLKKSLKFDLACVCLLQLAALAYGVYTMWAARPVWIAYSHGRFEIVTVPNIVGDLKSSKWASLRKLPTHGPQLIGLLPDNALRGQLDIEVGLAAGASLADYPNAWQPYNIVKQDALHAAKPLSKITNASATTSLILHAFELRYKKHPPVWLPLMGGQEEAIIILNAETGDCLSILTLALK